VIEVNHATKIGLLAIVLTVSPTGFTGAAAADLPVSFDVQTEEADDCTETVAGVDADRPCEVAETEYCSFVFEDRLGQPRYATHRCVLTVKTPSAP
jgi:hypothetical protein